MVKNNIRAICFDMDGVLIDFCDEHYSALNDALVYFGYPSIEYNEHLKVYNALTTKNKLKILAEKRIIKFQDVEKIYSLKQTITNTRIENVYTDWDKVKIMQRLYELDYKLACVTNSIKSSCLSILKKLGIIEYFSAIVTNEDVELNKPHPDPYKKACSLLIENPRNVLCIEDSDKGIKSAIDAGCRILKIETSKDLKLDLILRRINDINTSYKKFYENTIAI